MRIDYFQYSMSFKEKIKYHLMGIVIGVVVLWLFFKSLIILPLSIPMSILFVKAKKKTLIKRRKEEVLIQFIDMLGSLNDALKMSYSLEKSFLYARDEMSKLFGDNAYITMELNLILSKYEINIPVDKSFRDFAMRTGIDEIIFFSKIIEIGKKQGGNMINMVKNCINTLSEIVDAKRDVEVFLSGKVNEKRIMDKVPIFIIIYVFLTSKEMIEPLYIGTGRVVMILAIIVYIVAYYWGERIVDIKI